MFKVVLLLLFAICFTETEGKSCGIPPKCKCYRMRRLITCWKQNLERVPDFNRSEMKFYERLDLRWNNIRFYQVDNYVKKLFVDLRHNPINCSVVGPNAFLKTDCFDSDTITTSSGDSPKSSTRPWAAFYAPFESSTLTRQETYSLHHPSETTESIQSTFKQTLLLEKTKEPTIMSGSKLIVEPTDSSVDFYLHVTLGPIGFLYFIGSLAMILRLYIRRWRSGTRQRMGM